MTTNPVDLPQNDKRILPRNQRLGELAVHDDVPRHLHARKTFQEFVNVY